MTPPKASTTDPRPPEIAEEPGFLAPPSQPTNDPLDPEATTVAAPGPGIDEAASLEGAGEDGWDDDELEPPPTSTSRAGRSRGSSPSRAEVRAAFTETIGGLVGLASLGVHYARRAPDNLWIADEDDVVAIATPLARIAERHAPVDVGEATDLLDGLQAGIGTAAYVVKNIRTEGEYRAAAVAPPPPPEPAEGSPLIP